MGRIHNSWFIEADWPAPPSVRAGSTTCVAPANAVADFNLATHAADDVDTVLGNRRALRDALHLPGEPVWLAQVHGKEVLELGEETAQPPQADAAFTNRSDQICVVMTADCLPVLLCDRQGGIVAAVHAGWRGLQQQIIAATVNRMQMNAPELMAWIGPAISAAAYEIDESVREQFAGMQMDSAFSPSRRGKAGHWQLDLAAMARLQLRRLGVEAVYGGNFCTFNDQRFYSYRRDNRSGRFASLIWLQN